MKHRTLLLVLLVTAPSVFGQWLTINPTTDTFNATYEANNAIRAADAIKKYQDMILEAQALLNVQNTIKANLGDWQGVYDRAKAIQKIPSTLDQRAGASFGGLASVNYGQNAGGTLGYTAGGTYLPLGSYNVLGQPVAIAAAKLKRFAVVEAAYDNAAKVHDNTEAAQAATQKELGETYEEMAKPGMTQANHTKLLAKAQELQQRLAMIEAERREAADMLALQAARNANQAAKEALVEKEVQADNHAVIGAAAGSLTYEPVVWRRP